MRQDQKELKFQGVFTPCNTSFVSLLRSLNWQRNTCFCDILPFLEMMGGDRQADGGHGVVLKRVGSQHVHF